MAPGDVVQSWRKLPRHDKMKVVFSGVLLMWAMALSVSSLQHAALSFKRATIDCSQMQWPQQYEPEPLAIIIKECL